MPLLNINAVLLTFSDAFFIHNVQIGNLVASNMSRNWPQDLYQKVAERICSGLCFELVMNLDSSVSELWSFQTIWCWLLVRTMVVILNLLFIHIFNMLNYIENFKVP